MNESGTATLPAEEFISRTPESGRRTAHRRLKPTLNEIQHRAYRMWEAAGRPAGNCYRFWLEAERELLQAE